MNDLVIDGNKEFEAFPGLGVIEFVLMDAEEYEASVLAEFARMGVSDDCHDASED